MNTDDQDRSLGDAATFAGSSKRRSEAASLGDERTLGGVAAGTDTVFDDIDLVDLEARYRREGTLGRGGMGEVLLATDTRLDRRVAIKRIVGEAAGSTIAVQRFLTEAKAIARLNHPNIVQVYDYGWAKDGLPFLIMEYVDGGSLLDKCGDTALPLDEAIDLACQLCDGLARAHEFGIIHRDIKPANVLLTRDGIPKFADFGLAKMKIRDHGQSMTGGVLGTPDFMSPEQRRDSASVDQRSDLWSLAATVYQMATGRSPKIIWFDRLPANLGKVLGRALDEAKESRYQSALDFKEALSGLRNRGGTAGGTGRRVGLMQEGQCEVCGSPGDPSRKYCRNPACGASLRTNCLGCNAVMPVWEVICGECGGNQEVAVADMRAALERKRSEAESRLAALEVDEAASLAGELAALTMPRMAGFAEWGRQFATVVEDTRRQQMELADQQLEKAITQRDALDYSAAVQLLEAIPQVFRTDKASQYLGWYREARDKAESLLERIHAHVERNETDELVPLVMEARELLGDRADLLRICDMLKEKYADQAARARAALDAGDVQAAIGSLPSESSEWWCLSEGLGHLHSWVLDAAESDSALRSLVEETRRKRGAVGVDELRGLLAAAEKCLRLVPNSARASAIANKVRAALVRRDTSFAEAEAARVARQERWERERNEILARPVITNSIGMELRCLPGRGLVASGQREDGVSIEETTQVAPFCLGVHLVTNAQWKRVMPPSPSKHQADDWPVAGVTWQEANEFCRQLTAAPEESAQGRVYRLPSVDEWMYAGRANTTTVHSFGDNHHLAHEYGYWYHDHGCAVDRKKPNPWGFFDMYGNVHEWCSGECHIWMPPDDPHYGEPCRSIRGGSFLECDAPFYCAPQFYCAPVSLRRDDTGLRVALQVAPDH